jgi:hypothetical protein
LSVSLGTSNLIRRGSASTALSSSLIFRHRWDLWEHYVNTTWTPVEEPIAKALEVAFDEGKASVEFEGVGFFDFTKYPFFLSLLSLSLFLPPFFMFYFVAFQMDLA